jgi:hypothetical protein
MLMEKLKPLVVAGFAGIALFGGWQWNANLIGHPEAAVASAEVLPVAASPSPVPDVATAIQAMRLGLTDLRQAAKTGDPESLREAERDILVPLLDALAASKVNGKLDRTCYLQVVDAVNEAQGLFKEIPYFLEVQPGDNLPSFRLRLRRSPYPVIQARPRPLGWKVEVQGDGVILRP